MDAYVPVHCQCIFSPMQKGSTSPARGPAKASDHLGLAPEDFIRQSTERGKGTATSMQRIRLGGALIDVQSVLWVCLFFEDAQGLHGPSKGKPQNSEGSDLKKVWTQPTTPPPPMAPNGSALRWLQAVLKLELLEVQDLCLATLEGHERLDYAKGERLMSRVGGVRWGGVGWGGLGWGGVRWGGVGTRRPPPLFSPGEELRSPFFCMPVGMHPMDIGSHIQANGGRLSIHSQKSYFFSLSGLCADTSTPQNLQCCLFSLQILVTMRCFFSFFAACTP